MPRLRSAFRDLGVPGWKRHKWDQKQHPLICAQRAWPLWGVLEVPRGPTIVLDMLRVVSHIYLQMPAAVRLTLIALSLSFIAVGGYHRDSIPAFW